MASDATRMPVVDDVDLFPVLVRRVTDFLTKDQCVQIMSRLGSIEFGSHSALIGDASSTFNAGINDSSVIDEIEKFSSIKEKILHQTNAYARDFGTRPVELGNSWINIQRKGSELGYHTHPLSVISGALYVKVDADSSRIRFRNPNPFLDVTDVLNSTAYTSTTVYIAPQVGTLLLFPSWLKHGSDENLSDERVVLSFNTLFDPSQYTSSPRRLSVSRDPEPYIKPFYTYCPRSD
jgi:uncharacterized protein (TIGR02466 family)